jgi:pimeloyl-ACP methyl ester carboxylesterase
VFHHVNGAVINVADFGDGDNVFVAHGGWVGSWELWQQPFELMQKDWRCVSYDHRGSGATWADVSTITPDTLVDDLMGVLDALNIERCVLAGESLGGLTCATAVRRYPERFDGLVLVDASPRARRESMHPLIDGSRRDFPATVQWFVDACVPEKDAEHLKRWGRQILLRADPEAAARILECHCEEATTPDFAGIAVATLVLHGRLDHIIPLELAEEVARLIPHATMRVLDDAGHVPTVTRPHEVVDAINAWWASVRPSPAKGAADGARAH